MSQTLAVQGRRLWSRGSLSDGVPLKGSKPVAVALNEALGRLYAVDREGHRVVVFGLDGTRLSEFGERGNADGKFNIPLDIALGANGNVYVLDAGNFRYRCSRGRQVPVQVRIGW